VKQLDFLAMKSLSDNQIPNDVSPNREQIAEASMEGSGYECLEK